jgi:hypothetical protein
MSQLALIIAILLTYGKPIDYSVDRQEKLFLDGFAQKVSAESKNIQHTFHGYYRYSSENIYRYYDPINDRNVVVIFAEFELCTNCFMWENIYLVVPNGEAKGKHVIYTGECASIIVNPIFDSGYVERRVEHSYSSREDLKEFEKNLRRVAKARFGW